MKLQIKCSKCREILGVYEGDYFFIVSPFESFSLVQPKSEVLCESCWYKKRQTQECHAVVPKNKGLLGQKEEKAE